MALVVVLLLRTWCPQHSPPRSVVAWLCRPIPHRTCPRKANNGAKWCPTPSPIHHFSTTCENAHTQFYNATISLRRKTRRGECAIDSLSSTCRNWIEWPPPGHFLRQTHVLLQTNAEEFQILSYLCPVLRTREECLSWFSITSIINSSQFTETLKVKTTSMSFGALNNRMSPTNSTTEVDDFMIFENPKRQAYKVLDDKGPTFWV